MKVASANYYRDRWFQAEHNCLDRIQELAKERKAHRWTKIVSGCTIAALTATLLAVL